MPDKDHPIWKLAQGLIALAGLIWLGSHGMSLETLDADGAATGAVGVGITGKLVYQFLKS